MASPKAVTATILWVFVLPILLGVVWRYYVFIVVPDNGGSNANDDSDSDRSPLLGTGHMFDRIASRYDGINRVLALRMDVGWRKVMTGRVVQELSSSVDAADAAVESESHPWNVLDVATGTADVAIQLARDAPSKTSIVGVDPSRNMLDVGIQKIKALHLDEQITMQQADARDLSAIYTEHCAGRAGDNRCFDAVTMAFGIRNVVAEDRATALCELHKLLLPRDANSVATGGGGGGGGLLSIMEFSEPTVDEFGIMGWGASLFIRYVVPLVGGILSGAPKEYWHLQNSIQDFPPPRAFQAMLQGLECPILVGKEEMEVKNEDVVVEEDGDNLEGNDDGESNPHQASTTMSQQKQQPTTLVGYFDMEEIRHMNFGSVQLYVGRAMVRTKSSSIREANSVDPELPPIGRVKVA